MEESMKIIHFKTIPFVLVLVALAAISIAAQTTSGSLSGTVADSSRAAISGAQVQVTSTSRNETRSTQTNQDGRFVFPQLTPDTYVLQVEAKGFKGFKLEGLKVNANDKISAPDINLEVGTVSESVTVTASGEQLQTESGDRSSAITEDQ